MSPRLSVRTPRTMATRPTLTTEAHRIILHVLPDESCRRILQPGLVLADSGGLAPFCYEHEEQAQHLTNPDQPDPE